MGVSGSMFSLQRSALLSCNAQLMAAGTLFILYASMPHGFGEGSADLRYAQTMAFTTLVLFQTFNVFNARSDERSPFADYLATVGCGWR